MQKISALGLDLGSKRIGVAGCDGTGLIATGLTTIKRTSFIRDVAQLRELVRQRQVQILVVGLPYSLDGSFGPQAKKLRKLALRLSAALELPVEYENECLTSLEAQELVKAEKQSHSGNKGIIDRKAAAIILQQWLDRRRREAGRRTRGGDAPDAPEGEMMDD